MIFLAFVLEFLADYLPEIIASALAISSVAIIGTSTYQVTQGILQSGQAIEQSIRFFVEIMPFIILALMIPTLLRVFSSISNIFKGGGSS